MTIIQVWVQVPKKLSASSSATAAATRGLRAENRARVSDKNNADYQALEKVESLKVKDSDAWDFHKQLMEKENP